MTNKDLGIKGKVIWCGMVETMVITDIQLRALGWTDKMIEDFIKQIEEDID